jgi:hypothetical protein
MEGMGELYVNGNEVVLKAGREEGTVGEGEGVAFPPQCAGNAAFSNVCNHTYVRAKEGEIFELDGHVGGRTRCEAEVVGESVAWVGRRGFCGVSASG